MTSPAARFLPDNSFHSSTADTPHQHVRGRGHAVRRSLGSSVARRFVERAGAPGRGRRKRQAAPSASRGKTMKLSPQPPASRLRRRREPAAPPRPSARVLWGYGTALRRARAPPSYRPWAPLRARGDAGAAAVPREARRTPARRPYQLWLGEEFSSRRPVAARAGAAAHAASRA